jgi:hypothetical protein
MFGFPGFLALAVLFITWQNWRTRNWRSTFGRIAESRSASRDVRSKDRRFSPRSGNAGRSTTTTTDRIERKNFADIAYEYTVDGKRCFSRKIGLGPDDGTSGDVVALLKRYPVGKVVTVWYDPAAPGESILERDDPKRLREAWLGIAILTAVIVGGFYAFDYVLAWAQAHARNQRRVPFAMFATGAAVLLALIALAAVRRVREMRRWPTAPGTVVESRVEHGITRTRRGSQITQAPFYIPRVVYKFGVGGIDIPGDQHGRMISSTNLALAEQVVARLPVGTPVTVHYDPDQPTTAVVNPTGGKLALYLFLGGAVLLAIGYALIVL